MTTSLTQYFSSTDYLLALPMLLLTLFALGILMIDLMLPKQWKRVNAFTALAGLAFSAAAVAKLHYAYHVAQSQGLPFVDTGFMGSLLVDPFALYFFYLFLAGGAIAVLMSIRYLEIEHENHGEFYALLLFSIVGMMCMAAGYDIVLMFIGLELMAISTYVLVGFLRRDKRSNEAALKYLLLGAFSSGIFAYGLSLFYGLPATTNLAGIARGSATDHRHASQRSHRHLRAADHHRRPALQDCRGAVPSVGARCLRRRAHQRHRLHVSRGEGRGLGDVAAHLPLRALSAALDVRSAC